MNEITVFKHYSDTSSPICVDVFKVLNQIRTGGDKKRVIDEIRSLEGDEYKEAKKNLPIICFGGEFSRRSKEGLINGSGILTLDFDDGSLESLQNTRKIIEKDSCTIAAFSSPRERGRFKALMRIPVTNSDTEYKKYFAGLQKKYKNIDKSGKDISRATFFTYDPDIYINKDATVWDKQYETPKEKIKTQQYQVKDWDSVNIALRKIEDSSEGEKHTVRTKIAYLFGGWIKAGDISYQEAYNLIEGAVSKNTTDLKSAMKTVKACLSAGMDKPLNMSEQRQTLQMKVGLGRLYKPMSEVYDEVLDFYRNGYKKGAQIGWNCAKDKLTLLKGSTSLGFAAPFSGKSQFQNEVFVNIARTEGWTFVICSPETGDVAQIYGELISISAKQSFVGDYKMDEDTLQEHANFIAKHFIVIDSQGKDFYLRDFYTQVEAIEREFKVKVDCTCVDPYNVLAMDLSSNNGREDKAMGKDYDLMLNDARVNDRHNVIITHVRDQQIQKVGDQMFFPPPHPREMSGGQMSYRKGMLIWSAYRPVDLKGVPLMNENGEPYRENATIIRIHKSKPKGVAQVGSFELYYDFKKNSYYEIDEFTGKQLYALEEQPKKVTLEEAKEKVNSLTPNEEFETPPPIDDSEEENCPF